MRMKSVRKLKVKANEKNTDLEKKTPIVKGKPSHKGKSKRRRGGSVVTIKSKEQYNTLHTFKLFNFYINMKIILCL